MLALEIQSEDPTKLAGIWGRALDLEPETINSGQPVIQIDDARIRFVEATDG